MGYKHSQPHAPQSDSKRQDQQGEREDGRSPYNPQGFILDKLLLPANITCWGGGYLKDGTVTPYGLTAGHLSLLELQRIASASVFQLQMGGKAFCKGWKLCLSS